MVFYQNLMGAFITNPDNTSIIKKTEIDNTGHALRLSAEIPFARLDGEPEWTFFIADSN